MNRPVHARVVRRYPAPHYPQRPDVARDPALLAERLPSGWCRAELAGAVGAFLAVTTPGCRDGAALPGRAGSSAGPAALIAPLFEHGDGRGAFGCVAVAAPAFLSEDEALAIIRDVLQPYGLDAFERDVTLERVKVPVHTYRQKINWVTDERAAERIDEPRPFEADLFDPRRGLVLEYVSPQDDAIYADPEENYSSVWSVDYKNTARGLFRSVGEEGKGMCFGVFYDPLVYSERDWSASNSTESYEERRQRATQQARELLRAQVLDFANWLKAQGVL